MATQALHHFLDLSAKQWPEHVAVDEPGQGAILYRELAELSDLLCNRLHHLGVCRGDRVGIYMSKSIDAVASIFGILKAGAAYVPVDPGAPVARNSYILSNCSVKVVIVEERFVEGLLKEMEQAGEKPQIICVAGTGAGIPLKKALAQAQEVDPASAAVTENATLTDLAYILYTSGSTGKPKGVMLSHWAAISFVDWCSEAFEPTNEDRFSSHAPFHFDLSILDIYVPIKHGATLVLVEELLGKDPVRLAALIAEKQISVWYSTPSILSLLAQYGKLEQHNYAALRTVLFAGEVFPVKHLKSLKERLPVPRYFNLYGPTETNVCTYYEIPAHIPEERTRPFPIGKACSHYEIKVVDSTGQEVAVGEEGELCGSSPGVMQGYWHLSERTASAFLIDADGKRWYKTGDIVVEEDDGNYTFVGRKDRMVKKRGYRVELGEVEAGLYRHPAIEEAAVIALSDEENGVRLKAFLSCRENEKRPSLIALKRFCTENLPAYMVPDLFSFQEVLPKTSTDKIDYQRLKTLEH
ncbi:MAG: amino acid adenylation domain-containing protein [Anaerolineaceae bacterium]|nr:amino acid adenylation domain-containing protein [Anaerolineaceae bacterium]